jgi:hypothetical protein
MGNTQSSQPTLDYIKLESSKNNGFSSCQQTHISSQSKKPKTMPNTNLLQLLTKI